jgi:hypothetical protein
MSLFWQHINEFLENKRLPRRPPGPPGSRKTRLKSKYMPHQGKREKERRLRRK